MLRIDTARDVKRWQRVYKEKVERGSEYIVKIYSMKKSSCKIRQSFHSLQGY